MKLVLIALIAFASITASLSAPAATLSSAPRTNATPTYNEKVCAKLQELADEDCVALMCDDDIADGIFTDRDDCTTASDYQEAAQAACEDTLYDRVDAYNLKHPLKPVTCEE
jgi:hypothetical protein